MAHKAWDKRLRHFLRKYVRKFKGQMVVPPGPASWSTALVNFVETFLLLFTLTSINEVVRSETSGQTDVLGDFETVDWLSKERTRHQGNTIMHACVMHV